MRGLVGFLAGQVIALQFLLTGIVATEMAVRASADAFAICHVGVQSPNGQPGKTDPHVNHASCVICAFAAHAHPTPADTPQVVVLDVRTIVIAGVTSPAIETSQRHSPRTSQGPPLSA